MGNQEHKSESTFSILIVDDEQDILDIIKEGLADQRYKITCEIDPKKALQQIKKKSFDIILTDLKMPGISGMDLVNAVKESENDTIVIVITGHATLNTAIESIQLGVYDYVNKPINHKELQNLVYRATENLSLQRKNKELQQKNNRILANLSLLMDISKIIYQVTDLQSVFKMVTDTITEYFKLEKSAILMEDIQTGMFKIVASNNFDEAINKIEFKLPQLVNDIELSTDKETIISIKNKKFSFGDKKIPLDQNGWLAFCPVSFHDQIMGFLMVHSEDKNVLPSSEIIAMISILASQTAPMMYSLNFDQNRKPLLENDVVYFIRDNINKAKEVLSPITFALLRLEFNSPSGDPFSYQDMIRTAQTFIIDNMDKSYDLLWQSQDTALLIMSETDYFKAELFCKRLKNFSEAEYKAKEEGAGLLLHFSCLGYPEAGDTAVEITDHLWSKLMQEINSAKNDKIENRLEI